MSIRNENFSSFRQLDDGINCSLDAQDVANTELVDSLNMVFRNGYPESRSGSKLKWAAPNGLAAGLVSAYPLDGSSVDPIGSNNGTDTGIQYVAGKIGQAAKFSGISTSGLVSYYKLDANSNDSVGSNNGTDTAISYANAGIIGNCATFNGTTSKINIAGITLKSYADKTISIWFKSTGSSATYERILSDETSNNDANINLYVSPSPGNFGVLTNDGSTKEIDGLGAISANVWYHAVVIISKNNFIKLYLNNVQVGSTVVIGDNSAHGATSLMVGVEDYIGGTGFFVGSIDELAIFSRALSASEISSLYNAGAGTALGYFGSQIIKTSAVGLPVGNAPRTFNFWTQNSQLVSTTGQMVEYGSAVVNEVFSIAIISGKIFIDT